MIKKRKTNNFVKKITQKRIKIMSFVELIRDILDDKLDGSFEQIYVY